MWHLSVMAAFNFFFTLTPIHHNIFTFSPQLWNYKENTEEYQALLYSRNTVLIFVHLWTHFTIKGSNITTGNIAGELDVRYLLKLNPVFYFMPQTEFLAVIKATTEEETHWNFCMCNVSHALKLHIYMWFPLFVTSASPCCHIRTCSSHSCTICHIVD